MNREVKIITFYKME